MSKWKIEVNIDTGDDYETTDVVDNLVAEGLNVIREGLSALGITPTNYVKGIDPNGKEMM